MGLRCSVLGHDYGDSFVERDREERGDEVVVTERELKECSRCGAEKVTAENTEVRSLQAGSSADRGSTGTNADAPGASAGGATDSTSGGSPTGTDSPGASGGRPQSGSGADAADSGSAFSSPTDAIEQAESGMTDEGVTADADGEDAVILDDDDADGPGSDQWDEPAEPEADPEPEPEPVDDDAEVVDADAAARRDEAVQSGGPAEAAGQSAGAAATADQDADRSRGEWPDSEDADDEGFDATAGNDTADSTFEFGAEDGEVVESDAMFTSAGPLETDERTEADDLDFTLYCPECGFDTYAGGSSLRAGDICPECKKGYLAEDR